MQTFSASRSMPTSAGTRPIRRLLPAMLLAAVSLPAAAHARPAATVESGTLAGQTADGVSRFLGIPYAAPPVGDLRWAPPEAPIGWAGRRDARMPGPGCMQVLTPDGFGPWTKEYVAPSPVSEDCLTVNIWTPAKRGGKALPVLFWIHGGAFMAGSNAVPIYDGAALAKRGIIVVSVNYRLGVFGFGAFRELANDRGGGANFGLQDIVAALRWTQRNISAFGGDPSRVTIAGQSAGAMAVHMLLVSPETEGLFAQAIAQSGITELPLPERSEAFRRGDDLMARAKLSDIAALRRMSGEQIMQLLDAGPLAGTGAVGEAPLLGPVIDGRLLPDQIAALEAAGRRRALPVLVGLTADEGVIDPRYFAVTPRELRERIALSVGDKAADAYLAGVQAGGDAASAASRELTRRYGLASVMDWARGHPAELYAYYYTHAEPGPDAGRFGAFHSSEIPYVFETLNASPARGFQEQDRNIARDLAGYWSNFVKHGDPNGPGLSRWQASGNGAISVMKLDEKPGPYRLDEREMDGFARWLECGAGRSIFGIGIAARAPRETIAKCLDTGRPEEQDQEGERNGAGTDKKP